MSTEIKAPQFPESVADGTVATWHKKVGESVKRDELLVDIETDKVVLEVVAPADGVLKEIRKDEGDTVESQELLGIFEEGASAGAAADGGSKPAAEKAEAKAQESADEDATAAAGPAARKLMAEHGLDASRVEGSGKGGRITREDVEQALKSREQKSAPSSSPAPAKPTPTPAHAELPAVAGERE